MTNVFYKTFLSFFMILILGVNMAYAFDMLRVVNPSSQFFDSTDYFFGFGSFIDNFHSYFETNTIISGLNDALRNIGNAISYVYDIVQTPVKLLTAFGKQSFVWEIISMLFAILVFTTNIVPIVLMLAYGLMFIITILCYVITFSLFIMSFFAGAFKTPLPQIYEFDPPPPDLAISRVIPSCMLHLAL